MFSVEFLSVNSDSDIIILDSNITITLELTNNLIKELKCTEISLSLYCQHEDVRKSKRQNEQPCEHRDGHKTTFRNLKMYDWTMYNLTVPIEMEEQFDYKQDHSLKSASLACANLQNALKRRDSHSGLCKEKDVIKGDFSNSFSVKNVLLHPGKNVVSFRSKVRNTVLDDEQLIY